MEELTERADPATSVAIEVLPAAGGNGAGPTTAPPALDGRPAAPAARAPARAWRSRLGWERLSRLVLAFAIAFLLWAYVLNLENPALSSPYTQIPITPRGLDKNLNLSSDLGTATITVQAPADVLSHVSRDDLSASVDLAGRGPGTYRLPIQVTGPANVYGLVVDPPDVQVQVEEVSERRMTVQVRAIGTPGLGYRADPPQVHPVDVLVRGPRDQVEQIDQVVADVNIEGKQGTQAGEVRPRALDFQGQEINNLVFQPATVEVTIAIQQLLNYKTLPVHVPVEGAPAPGYGVTNIVVTPTTLTAFGPPTVLEPLNFLATGPISINGATQTVNLSVTVPLTRGLTLYPAGALNQVQVRVEIQELSTRTRLSVLIHRVGLAPGLVSVESPDRVDVTLNGPFDTLQNLQPDSVQALVDVTGLGPGTYKLTPVVTVPARTIATQTDPTEVTVVISGAPTATPAPTTSPTATPSLSATPVPLPSPPGTPPGAPAGLPLPTAFPQPSATPPPTASPSPRPAAP